MNYSFVNHILKSPLQYLKGVGPQKSSVLKNLGFFYVKDLILNLPIHYIDRRKIIPLNQIKSGELLSQIVKIDAIFFKTRGKKSIEILCSNQTGSITLIFFNIYKRFLDSWKVGDKVAISGKAKWHYGEMQMIHPDIMVQYSRASEVFIIEPVYSASIRMSSKIIRSIIKTILTSLPILPEWLPDDLKTKLMLPSWNQAVNIIHNPQNDIELQMISKAIERLALDEILAEQLLLKMIEKKSVQQKKMLLNFTGNLSNNLIEQLPFELTQDQKIVLAEIEADQKSNQHMLRVLQGDVGSGKTIIAFLSAINTIEAGFQAIIMAPTELLAKQHFENFKKLFLNNTQIVSCLLVSKISNAQKKQLYSDISAGKIELIIGTHALIQAVVQFYKPGLIIIDEQHKFGVKQRLELLEKGMICDLLMISATPIPRTLSMMFYGMIKISILKEKPKGRLPVITSLLSVKKMEPFVQSLKGAIVSGAKVYWICPLIKESEKLPLNDVQERCNFLQKIFGAQVAIIHSKMRPEKREEIMRNFASKDGKIKILVATTVIEVGVDIEDATIMVIEHAECFGLAQMHQLRGRVGRGAKQSYCVLFYSEPLSMTARYRLQAMKKSNNGFELAEEDFKIRGSGKIFGVQQSGVPLFKVYNIFSHKYLLKHVTSILGSMNAPFDEKSVLLINIYQNNIDIVPEIISAA